MRAWMGWWCVWLIISCHAVHTSASQKDNAPRTKGAMALKGALLGGVLGAGGAYLAGDDTTSVKSGLTGAAVGVGVGLLLGGGVEVAQDNSGKFPLVPDAKATEPIPEENESTEDPTTLDEMECGVAIRHQKLLQDFAKANKVALLIRPSELDSIRLSRYGDFACKSVDIKAKSSNWGVHAGFVPLDPYFSKKDDKDLEAEYLEPAATPCDTHAAAVRAKVAHDKEQDEERQTGVGVIHLGVSVSYLQADRVREVKDDPEQSTCGPNSRLYVPLPDTVPHRAKDIVFCVDRADKVYWFRRGHSPKRPLYVWAYNCDRPSKSRTGVPSGVLFRAGDAVTGDYDLFMSAFHVQSPVGKHMNAHMPLEYMSVPQYMPIKGGESFSSEAEALLFATDGEYSLNKALFRPAGREIFQHGAEMLNLKWRQVLDTKITVFDPDRDHPFLLTSEATELQQYFLDLLQRGYLFAINPDYGRYQQRASESGDVQEMKSYAFYTRYNSAMQEKLRAKMPRVAGGNQYQVFDDRCRSSTSLTQTICVQRQLQLIVQTHLEAIVLEQQLAKIQGAIEASPSHSTDLSERLAKTDSLLQHKNEYLARLKHDFRVMAGGVTRANSVLSGIHESPMYQLRRAKSESWAFSAKRERPHRLHQFVESHVKEAKRRASASD